MSINFTLSRVKVLGFSGFEETGKIAERFCKIEGKCLWKKLLTM